MTVRAKLKDLAPGTVFNAGPIDVRVLEHFADGRTLLIADTCIADRHFADQPFKTRPEKPAANPNDWRFSNLNRELNTEFLATFDQAEGPIRSKDILTADWSLADHEGGEGYGIIQAKIALLTQTMYEKYADQDLLELDDWWWLITPYAGIRVHCAQCQRGRQSAQPLRVQWQRWRSAGFLRGIWDHVIRGARPG